MNQLAKYLKMKKQNTNQFAQKSGLSQATVWRIVNGKVTPSSRIAKAIETATQGEVTRDELLYPDEAA